MAGVVAPSMLDEESWRCATCLDLLFKPSVNWCGHLACFWCMHRAMSPWAPSACPICRSKYAALPGVCGKLHRFLAGQFPEAYAQRREETGAEEQESGGASPEPDAGLVPPPGGWTPQHFVCDHPRCGKLLCQPAVLPCGHCVCRPTCLDAAGSSGSDAAAAGAAAGPASPAGGASSSGAARYECPACGLAVRHLPTVCKQLEDLLREMFAEQVQQREREAQEQLAAAAATGAHAPGAASPPPQPPAGAEEGGEPSTPRASQAPSEHDAAAGGVQAAQPGAQEALSPSLEDALRRRAAEGGPAATLAERLEANLRRLTSGAAYTHHGVGCDACGQYPIQGRRFRCQDCAEAMGFDLCGDCMDRGVSSIVGRFNQRHTPAHRMELVRPRVTAMHMLQAANPELPFDQLLWLLELSARGDGDDEEAPPAAQQQQPPPQQQQQPQGQQAGGGGSAEGGGAGASGQPGSSSTPAGGEMPIPRRGPRPAFVPEAEEPSPSAYAPQQQQAQQQQQQGGEAAGLIEEEEEAATVHVPLERVLPPDSRGAGP